jgi:hypothetical protein
LLLAVVVGGCWRLLAVVGGCWRLLVVVGGCWQLLQPYSYNENGEQSTKQQTTVVDNNFGSVLLSGGKLQSSEGEVSFSLRQCV